MACGPLVDICTPFRKGTRQHDLNQSNRRVKVEPPKQHFQHARINEIGPCGRIIRLNQRQQSS